MTVIAVTGAAGAVGRRVVRQLAAGGPIDGERLRILAVDRDDLPTRLAALEAVEPVRLDLLAAAPEQVARHLGGDAQGVDGVDVVVHLAEEDTDPQDRYLPRSRGAMSQGPHRFDRGQNFFATAREAAEDLEVKLRWTVSTVPGVGHSNSRMAPHAAKLMFGK